MHIEEYSTYDPIYAHKRIFNIYHLLIYIWNRRSLEENSDAFQNVPVGNLMSLQEFEGILDFDIWCDKNLLKVLIEVFLFVYNAQC